MGALLGIMLSAALGRYDSHGNCRKNQRKKAISRMDRGGARLNESTSGDDVFNLALLLREVLGPSARTGGCLQHVPEYSKV